MNKKKIARNIKIIGSDNDNFIPKKDFEILSKNLDAEFNFLENRGHFCDFELPELLPILDDAEKNNLDWLEKIKTQQTHWIGKSEGAEIEFPLEKFSEKIKVFTTRPDTIFGATYMVLSPEHILIKKITTKEQEKKVFDYIKKSAQKSDLERTELQKEKTGVFCGAYAINPVNEKKIPIWIADYVLMTYGTGAIMAVPGHDERDFSFAQKYDLPIKIVVKE